MQIDCDVLIVGGGPAGAALAIGLAQAGWRVLVCEQHTYPRRKVCGESLAVGGLGLLDALGVGAAYRAAAGPELDRVGWMSGEATVIAPFPACEQGPDRYGRALGRDRLDLMLLERARALGAEVLQPVRVRRIGGGPGRYRCDIDLGRDAALARKPASVTARVVVAAYGSWGPSTPAPAADSDLFAFKASFMHSRLPPGLLSVLAFGGGYGGIVVGEERRTTLACCVRRDLLRRIRAADRGRTAGSAVEAHLRRSCRGVREALADAQREGGWLAVGPIRPGVRLGNATPAGAPGVFRIGNAAGEVHPLIGEGITMALHSAALLSRRLGPVNPAMIDETRTRALQREFGMDWRQAFSVRKALAFGYAHLAMRPMLSDPARVALVRWPGLLTEAARRAGKATPVALAGF
jgi:2-polyprenyl-6-methoxyphenol hydroxylase-like FAD-dependent oxidoreductase